MIVLPSLEKDIGLPLTLHLVDAIEKQGGSLFKIADQLVAKEMPMGDIIRLLSGIYGFTGNPLPPDDVAHVLRTRGIAPAVLLSNILLAILTPLQYLGAVKEDHDPAAA